MCIILGSSAEFVGLFRYREFAKGMIEKQFQQGIAAEAIGPLGTRRRTACPNLRHR